MHISARTDYAVRAMLVIAHAHPRLVKAAEIAKAQRIPVKFLTTILVGKGYDQADQQIIFGVLILLVVASYGRERRLRDRV